MGHVSPLNNEHKEHILAQLEGSFSAQDRSIRQMLIREAIRDCLLALGEEEIALVYTDAQQALGI